MKGFKTVYIILIQCFFLISALSFSCRREPLKLSTSQKVIVDTIVRNQTPILRAKLDSICDAEFDARVTAAKDSIIKVRLKEIEERLGK